MPSSVPALLQACVSPCMCVTSTDLCFGEPCHLGSLGKTSRFSKLSLGK